MNKPLRLPGLRIARLLALALALLLACAKAYPQSNGITCGLTSYAMGFGSYDPSSQAATDGSGSVGVNCTDSTKTGGSAQSVSVTLASGTGSYGSFATRQMQLAGGGDRLAYNLYIDSARSQIWGDGTSYSAQTLLISNIPRFGSKSGSLTFYGRIPALQNVSAGNYADYVTITISP